MKLDTIILNNIVSFKQKIEFWKKNSCNTWLKAIFAGFFISTGGIASSIAASAITNAGIAKLVAASIFPIGLIFIILLCGELFTGDCLIVNSWLAKKVKFLDMIAFLLFVWFGNLVGAGLFAGFVKYTGIYSEALAGYIMNLASAKVNSSCLSLFVSGVFCNIFVCMAVLLASGSESIPSKIIKIFIPIFTFVLCGFEHSVADMFYLAAAQIVGMNISWIGIVKVLGMVTLGNFVGGAIVFGVLLAFMYEVLVFD